MFIINILGACTSVYAPDIQTPSTSETNPLETHEAESEEYTIQYQGLVDVLLNSVDKAKSGEEIEIKTSVIYDADLLVTVNGAAIERSHYDSDYWGFKFIMPNENVVVNIKGVGNKEDRTYDWFIISVPWREVDEVMDGCLNHDKIILSDQKHTPIFKIEGVGECYSFINSYAHMYEVEYALLSRDPLSVTVGQNTYDEEFFDNNVLLVAYIFSSSGSLSYGLSNVEFIDKTICIDAEQTNYPEVGTCDMKGWLLIVEVPKSDLVEIEHYDAILK